MRSSRILPVLFLFLLLPSCNSYEKENKRLDEEIKMARQENDVLKAEIVGLKKELDEMGAKAKMERKALEAALEEDRRQMEMKLEDRCEAPLKKAQDASKGSHAPRTGTGRAESPRSAPKE